MMLHQAHPWRQALHLEPPHGWLNDPNGLCCHGGRYHVFFQFTPHAADGCGERGWGHFESPDLLHWRFTGMPLHPDTPADRDGAYSGCAVCPQGEDGEIELFYTGNVKEPGPHDYIYTGRGANVILAPTPDGVTVGPKQVLLRSADYPAWCSCHVRDPKIWRQGDTWQMVLGARAVGGRGPQGQTGPAPGQDYGCVLFYESADRRHWAYTGHAAAPGYGYMWECPDCFTLGGARYLSVCPQGVAAGECDFQNVYSAGYFRYENDELTQYTEWDKGFDFYAPQTFVDAKGRRLLLGWMGIGDIPYRNPTAALGWQHCLTLPRVITAAADGTLLQNPAPELEELRGPALPFGAAAPLPFDLTAPVTGPFALTLADAVTLAWDGTQATLTFTDGEVAAGRTQRRAALPQCRDVRLVADRSSLEIYLDGGRCVFTTRFYPKAPTVPLQAQNLTPTLYPLRSMRVEYAAEP